MCDAPYHRRLLVRVSGDSFLEMSRSDHERKVDGGKVHHTCFLDLEIAIHGTNYLHLEPAD